MEEEAGFVVALCGGRPQGPLALRLLQVENDLLPIVLDVHLGHGDLVVRRVHALLLCVECCNARRSQHTALFMATARIRTTTIQHAEEWCTREAGDARNQPDSHKELYTIQLYCRTLRHTVVTDPLRLRALGVDPVVPNLLGTYPMTQ